MAPAFVDRDRNCVCVMDASSRLGYSLVERLLQRGYSVHAASYNHGECGGSLRKLAAGDGRRLKVLAADPFDYQSIVEAVRGCSGLFYTFDPPQGQAYDEFMVEVEVRAAHNALEACAHAETVERVVFMSSVTAVVWGGRNRSADDDDRVVDERDWSDPNFCKRFKLWHALAKTLAERTAWALAMDRGVDMVAVNAGLPSEPELAVADLQYLDGAQQMYDDGVLVTVDADYLVDAHVAAYESPAAYGRYLCFRNAVCRAHDAVKLVQALSPKSPSAPPWSEEMRPIRQRIQNKKLCNLMVEFDATRTEVEA